MIGEVGITRISTYFFHIQDQQEGLKKVGPLNGDEKSTERGAGCVLFSAETDAEMTYYHTMIVEIVYWDDKIRLANRWFS